MAKVYAVPEEIAKPVFDYRNIEASLAAERAYVQEICDLARETNKGDLVGTEVHYPVADGAATYVVWTQRPLALIHVDTGDAYRLQPFAERGLAVADIREFARRAEALSKLFSQHRGEDQ